MAGAGRCGRPRAQRDRRAAGTRAGGGSGIGRRVTAATSAAGAGAAGNGSRDGVHAASAMTRAQSARDGPAASPSSNPAIVPAGGQREWGDISAMITGRLSGSGRSVGAPLDASRPMVKALASGIICVQHRCLRVRASIRREPPMDFIFMLTRNDRTIEDAGDLSMPRAIWRDGTSASRMSACRSRRCRSWRARSGGAAASATWKL